MANKGPMRAHDAGPKPLEIETVSEVLADGTMLELVRDPSDRGEPRLVAWNGSDFLAAGERFAGDGKVYVPARLRVSELRALRLPGGVKPHGSSRELFDAVAGMLTRFSRLPEGSVSQITYFLFASWLVDCLQLAPVLYVVAPLGSPRVPLLQLISVLGKCSLMLAEASPSSLCSLPMHWRPTLLFNEPHLNARFLRLLYSANAPRHVVFRNGEMLDIFSAKVICFQEPLVDPLLASQALHVVLQTACRDLPVLGPEESEQIAAEFQPKFLNYRLSSRGKVRIPAFDVSGLTPPMQDVARSLGASIVGDDDLQRGVISVLRERDQDLRTERSTSSEATILEVLLCLCHEEAEKQVLSGEVADMVNALWAERGEDRHTTPESVGRKLCALGLRTEPIGARGNGLELTDRVQARVHELVRSYAIPSLQRSAKDGCLHCAAAAEEPPERGKLEGWRF